MATLQLLWLTCCKKNAFSWSQKVEEAFELLKQTMMQAPFLALPNFQLLFVVECDASGNGLGAVLMQEQRPIAYFSTALNGKRLLLSTYENELMALVLTVKEWQPYLLGHHFVVQTNQHNLKFLWEQQIMTEPQQKWLLKLMGYDFPIEFKRGKNNMAANALSRNDTRGEFNVVSSPLPQWLESIKVENQSHLELQRIHQLHEQGEAIGPWENRNGEIFFKERIYLPSNSELTQSFSKKFMALGMRVFTKLFIE